MAESPRIAFHATCSPGRRVASRHQLVLLLRHLEDTAVERFRERHLVFAAHLERARLDAAKDEFLCLVLVRPTAFWFGGEIRDGVFARVRPSSEVDDAVERSGLLPRSRRNSAPPSRCATDRAVGVHAEAEAEAAVPARRVADAPVERGPVVCIAVPAAAA